jgi:hypothetical protein
MMVLTAGVNGCEGASRASALTTRGGPQRARALGYIVVLIPHF